MLPVNLKTSERKEKNKAWRERKKQEILLLKAAAEKRKKDEFEAWKLKIRPVIALTRTYGFRLWFEEHTKMRWYEGLVEDRMNTLFLFDSDPLKSLVRAFSSFQELSVYLANYKSIGNPILENWELRLKRIANATPSWVDYGKILELRRIRREYNELYPEKAPWHIDHIIPLAGERVCGLHVHTNMQLLPGSDNFKKNNKFDI